jgi:hypothetical protein
MVSPSDGWSASCGKTSGNLCRIETREYSRNWLYAPGPACVAEDPVDQHSVVELTVVFEATRAIPTAAPLLFGSINVKEQIR